MFVARGQSGSHRADGGTGKPPPDNHLGTSVTMWRGTLPSYQLPDLLDALRGRDRPARWRLEGEARDGLAAVQVTMHVYWRQPSHGSVSQHVFLVHRDLVGRLEARTDARFDAQPVQAEFEYADEK
jgi:hypothetical protein